MFVLIFRTLVDVPGAPSKPEPSNVSTTTIHLKWSPPQSDGGNAITSYIIEQRESFARSWTRVLETKTTDVECTITGLKEGSEYQFRVSAENKAGVGKPSEPSTPLVAKSPYGRFESKEEVICAGSYFQQKKKIVCNLAQIFTPNIGKVVHTLFLLESDIRNLNPQFHVPLL